MVRNPIPKTKESLKQWEAFRRGDQQALADLFLNQYDTLYRYGHRLYGCEDLVKDCIQELFLKLWHRRDAVGAVVEVTPYLCKALRRSIIDALREGTRRYRIWNPADEDRLDVIFSHEDFLISQQIDQEQRQRLTRALNQLTRRQREAIHLRYFEDFEPYQIAQIMGLSDQSVYNLLYRSVQALRDNFFLLLLLSVQ
ncbi:RNA polymerase sigma factor [Salmonirosea aquatica]|uniref:Sigma-70 family RNA polymerase sigma factor n=1 Tax=Salmonirosea aquatica TaxID=2654236 RepID=A0A7C9BDD9_9BACT|nr:sigma-70 family RNA polymerase sigma factor [Cytophagaceae bacterium SJW1-29]